MRHVVRMFCGGLWLPFSLGASMLPTGGLAEPPPALTHYELTRSGPSERTEALPLGSKVDTGHRAKLLLTSPGGGVFLVEEAGGHRHRAWSVSPGTATPRPVQMPLQESEEVLCGAHVASAIFVGTTHGLLEVGDGAAKRLNEFAVGGTYIVPGPLPLTSRVQQITGDGGLNVWLADGSAFGGSQTFSMDRRQWIRLGDAQAQRTFPYLRPWHTPGVLVRRIAGNPREGGLWIWAETADGAPRLLYLDPSMPGASSLKKPLRVATGPDIPRLSNTLLVADSHRRAWLAGERDGAGKVYQWREGAFEDVSPPAELLRSRQFTQLMVDALGRLHAATDGVGVLLRDAGGWRSHPVNRHLAALPDGAKPADHIALDEAGNLWVANGCNLLCWRGSA